MKVALLLLLTSFLPFHYSLASPESRISVKVAEVKVISFHDKFSAVGSCQNSISKNYYAQVTGAVDFIDEEITNEIEKDKLLMIIDQNIATAIKEHGQAAYNSAKIAFNRDKELFEKNVLSKDSFEKSKVTYESAKLAYARSMQDYENLVFKAPFKGNVGLVQVRIGDRVKPGDLLFSITSSNDSTILYELPEDLIRLVDKDTEVNLTANDNNKIKGKVVGVANYLAQNGSIMVKVVTLEKNDSVHGSYIEAEFIINKHNALSTFDQSVLKNDKGNFVYKLEKDNKVKQIYVQLGSKVGDFVEITSDEIKEGDQIILEGLTKVHEGSEVEVIK